MALDILLQEVSGMSEADLNQIIRFVRFIKIESANEKNTDTVNKNTSGRVIRQAGIYKGKGWSEDGALLRKSAYGKGAGYPDALGTSMRPLSCDEGGRGL